MIFILSVAVILYICFDGIVNLEQSGISKSCDQQQFIDEGQSFVITFTQGNLDQESNVFSNQFSSSCQMFITHPGLLLNAKITYHPTNQGCHHGYLTVGNDRYRPDLVSMTSYQFCENVYDTEIVSRSNVLWIVHRNRFRHKIEGKIIIEAHQKVVCNTSQYECSPLQCEPMTSLCNGLKECENGRDEYCNSTEDNCFLCDDGTCILPTLPRYHYNWGRAYWYICDGFNHCKDGSDEIKDKCDKYWSSLSEVYSCKSTAVDKSYLTWNNIKCSIDNNSYETGKYERKKINGTSIIITTSALFIVLSCSVCFFIRLGKKKKRRHAASDDLSSRCRIYRDTTSDDITTRLNSSETNQQT